MNSPIFQPVAILAGWTMVMLIWMYICRLPAMNKANIDLDPAVYTKDDLKKLPQKVQWKADNYNHLLELPTVFYAVAISLAVLEIGDGLNLWLAWAFVGLRIIHSLVQATVNVIIVRFAIFLLSSLALLAMVVHLFVHVFFHH